MLGNIGKSQRGAGKLALAVLGRMAVEAVVVVALGEGEPVAREATVGVRGRTAGREGQNL